MMPEDNGGGWSRLDWLFFILINLVAAICFVFLVIIPHTPYEGLMGMMLWFFGIITVWCVY